MEALAAALGERALPVRMFGADLPADALREAARRTGPRAVALWAQARTTADTALAGSLTGIEWGPRGARGHSALLPAGPGRGAGSAAPATALPPPSARTERLLGLRSGLAVIESVAAGRVPATAAGRSAPGRRAGPRPRPAGPAGSVRPGRRPPCAG
ncbi:hypothetical protein [Streptomyces sp. NBC_00454]|uniref:hypothetical protein n=1 Tax=Streptomyces sp. NBC_00454 TaxID=2975747 RepID=UPI00352FC76A